MHSDCRRKRSEMVECTVIAKESALSVKPPTPQHINLQFLYSSTSFVSDVYTENTTKQFSCYSIDSSDEGSFARRSPRLPLKLPSMLLDSKFVRNIHYEDDGNKNYKF